MNLILSELLWQTGIFWKKLSPNWDISSLKTDYIILCNKKSKVIEKIKIYTSFTNLSRYHKHPIIIFHNFKLIQCNNKSTE